MNIPLPKLKAIIRYFCTYTNPLYLGKVKLMKLFYFLDFIHVKKYGAPVTYDKYIKLEHGPIPSFIKNLIDSVSDDPANAILSDTCSIEKVDVGKTGMQKVTCNRSFTTNDTRYFNNSELAVLKLVCQKYGQRNTRDTENASHDEAPWKETKLLEEIPYSLATHDLDAKVTKEEVDLLMKITKRKPA